MEHIVPGMNLTYPINKQVDQTSATFVNSPNLKLDTSITWIISKNMEYYQDTFEHMKFMQDLVHRKYQSETVWILEMDSVYTSGKMASEADILFKDNPKSPYKNIPVISTSRGGKVTYHGPGQRVCYIMMDIKKRNIDIRKYVWMLEEVVIRTLNNFCVRGFRKQGLRGVFVEMPETGLHKKIAALGVSVSHGVTMHGFALNNTVDLNFFNQIIPCGIKEYGVTSLKDYGVNVNNDSLDLAIQTAFYSVF